jgi:Transglutaminase-like superfamily
MSPRISRLASLRRFCALPAIDRRRLIRAALRLLAIDLRLRLRGFASVESSFDRRSVRPGGAGESSIEPWARSVDVAARHHLYPMHCVPRALALRSLLAEEGIVTELRIGVRKEDDRLVAHAWVEHQGVPIGESLNVGERFAPLTRADGGEGARAARGAFC